jgi:hypothetical protein
MKNVILGSVALIASGVTIPAYAADMAVKQGGVAALESHGVSTLH